MRRFFLTALVLVPFGLALLSGCGDKKPDAPTGKVATPPAAQPRGSDAAQ